MMIQTVKESGRDLFQANQFNVTNWLDSPLILHAHRI